ncbi:phage baseplate assembly protein [uncultured Mailhella sp.]|uniref:phage baseplate assembly protein n=1 Tax=uncultured Mailhella sp. TaxID=1981031 RepID=UPI0032091B28
MDDITLTVGGVDWTGWESIQASRSVDAMAGAFSLGLADRVQYGGAVLPLSPGMECVLSCGSDTLVTGFIDSVSQSLDSGRHGITVSGRDKSADLVDASAVHTPGSWKGASLMDICTALCAPFGVAVTLEGNQGQPFTAFQIQPGESVAEAMQRLLKQRELVAMPDGKGGIRLARLAQETLSAVLQEGVNVLSASVTYDASERYSEYLVTCQKKGTDKDFGKACSVKAKATDEQMQRYRPLVIRASQQGDVAYMRQRAQWEMTTRRADGTSVQVTVQGWRDSTGRLWAPGVLVPVHLPTLGISQNLLIGEVTWTRDRGGTTTQLTLKDPAAWQPEPEKPKKSTDSGSSTDWDLYVKQAEKAKAEGQKVQEVMV